MKELSAEETSELANAYVKTFGYREAARKLAERGYRSREGKEIRHAHLSRILGGSTTQFLTPEPEPKEEKPESPARPVSAKAGSPPEVPTPALTRRPGCQEQTPSPLPLVAEKEPVAIPLEETEREEDLRELHARNRKALKAELEDEEELRKLREAELPGLVPAPSGHAGHAHPQDLARPHAVFDRRRPVEIKANEEGTEETFFGIPKLIHKPPVTKSRAYEPKSYGGFSISTKDINVRQKKRS